MALLARGERELEGSVSSETLAAQGRTGSWETRQADADEAIGGVKSTEWPVEILIGVDISSVLARDLGFLFSFTPVKACERFASGMSRAIEIKWSSVV